MGNFGQVTLPGAQISIPDGRHDLTPPVPYPLSLGPTDLAPGNNMNLQIGPDQFDPSNLAVTAAPQVSVSRSASGWTVPAGGGVETVTVTVTPTQSFGFFDVQIAAVDSLDGGNVWGTIEPGNVTAPPGDSFRVDGGHLEWQSNSPQPNQTYTFVVMIDVPTGGTFKPVVDVTGFDGAGGSNGVGTSTTLTDPGLGGTVTFSWAGRARWNSGLGTGREITLGSVAQPVSAPVTTTLNVTVHDPGGAPASGAFVEACDTGLFGCHAGRTDANGLATITGDVPAGTAGPLHISVNGSSANGSGSAGPFDVSPGDTVAPTLDLHAPIAPPADVTITERGTTSAGVPIVTIHQPVTLAADGCTGGTATYTITGATQLASGSMTESPAGSGHYSASVGVPFNASGPATVSISISCPSPSDNRSVSFDVVYSDPSGTVETTSGAPIAGATVTLYRSDTGAPGSFVPVPNGSTLLSPDNRTNPDHTDAAGNFGWNVLAGFYYVHAEAPGCTPADSPVSQVPPPVTGIVLKLACSTPPRPEATIQLNPSTRSLVVSGRGATLVSATPLGGGQVKYLLAGAPGQSLALVLKASTQGQTLDAQIVSLQYGGGTVQTPTATLHYDWSLNKNGTIKQLHQDLQVGTGQAKQHLNAQFDGAKNQTALDGNGAGHSSLAGLAILRIATAAGVLSIQH
jgi:hypothetical protein